MNRLELTLDIAINEEHEMIYMIYTIGVIPIFVFQFGHSRMVFPTMVVKYLIIN